MLRLPFFNRKRYIELKCYTNNPFHIEHSAIVLSSKLPAMKSCRHINKYDMTFRTCYGDVAGLKRSAALPAWTEMDFEGVSEKDGVYFYYADNNKGLSKIDVHPDPVYQPRGSTLLKISSPWMLEEKTGVTFVMGKHIRNTTPMSIPCGVINFKHCHAANIFNLVQNHPHQYRLPFKMPMIALYPMSDLPLYVESICDPTYRDMLHNKSESYGHFRGDMLKVVKNKS